MAGFCLWDCLQEEGVGEEQPNEPGFSLDGESWQEMDGVCCLHSAMQVLNATGWLIWKWTFWLLSVTQKKKKKKRAPFIGVSYLSTVC